MREGPGEDLSTETEGKDVVTSAETPKLGCGLLRILFGKEQTVVLSLSARSAERFSFLYEVVEEKKRGLKL